MLKLVAIVGTLGSFPLCLLCGCALEDHRSDQIITVRDIDSYREALEGLDQLDQLHRSARSWGTVDSDELSHLDLLSDDERMLEWSRRKKDGVKLDPNLDKYLAEKQRIIDQVITNELMHLIELNGWPTAETAGDEFPSPVPMLIHMPMSDMERVLPILRIEVLAERMPPDPYAMIYDRKQQHDGKPQLYGKSLAFDFETQSVLPAAIIDIEATNKARLEIGLDPLEEYRITDEKTAAGQ